MAKDINRASLKIIRLIKTLNLFVDWSKTSNEKECQISYEDFVENNSKILFEFNEFLNESYKKRNSLSCGSLYNFYAKEKGVSLFKGLKHTIYDLIIRGIKIFSKPVQWGLGQGHLTFSNILFENSQIRVRNWKDVCVKSPQFVKCKVDLRNIFDFCYLFEKTKFLGCSFFDNHLTGKKAYKYIEKIHGICEFLLGIVQSEDDLKDCKLVIRNKKNPRIKN